MTDAPKNSHWLVRPGTIRCLWWVFGIVLASTVIAQLVFGVKGYFGVDDWVGFAAVFGFLACLVMVLVAKGLGLLLKRSEEYYNNGKADGDTDA